MNYDLVSVFEKLNIDITTKEEITLKEYKDLYDFFYNNQVSKIVHDRFFYKLIEKVPSIEMKHEIYRRNPYFIKTYENGQKLYFYFETFSSYRIDEKIYLRMYWSGKYNRIFDDFDSDELNEKEMKEAINFFKDCPFYEGENRNSINIYLDSYNKITEESLDKTVDIIANLFL